MLQTEVATYPLRSCHLDRLSGSSNEIVRRKVTLRYADPSLLANADKVFLELNLSGGAREACSREIARFQLSYDSPNLR